MVNFLIIIYRECEFSQVDENNGLYSMHIPSLWAQLSNGLWAHDDNVGSFWILAHLV